MSIYHEKLLELLAIEEKEGQFFLHIKLFFGQDTELFWKIDEETAHSIQSIFLASENIKYRLSFQASIEVKQSFLTKTYLDHSEKIYFSCSTNYIKELNSIKKLQDICHISNLSFLSMNLVENDKQVEEQKEVEEENLPKIKKPKASKSILGKLSVAATVLSIIGIILFIYHPILNNDSIPDLTVVQAKTVEHNERPVNMETKEDIDEPVETPSPSLPVVPVLEVNELVTYSLPEGMVALTFDDGPSKFSLEISNVLMEYGVGGTFFFTGLNAQKHPDYVKEVHSKGFSIGSHSMNHVDVSVLSYSEQERELTESIELIEEITGEKIHLFRPPFGAKNETTIDLMSNYQSNMILWNRDPEDWRGHSAEVIFQYVKDSNPSGSIILLHESQAVIEALPMIIEYLQKQNLQIVTLK